MRVTLRPDLQAHRFSGGLRDRPVAAGAIGGSGGAVGGSSSPAPGVPAVYVQNPWTGEYLEARAVDIARHESQRALVGAARKGR